MKLKRGVLVVLDGIDGTGKTTQALALIDSLRREGYEAVGFREPSQSRWGREIRKKALRTDSLKPEEELDLFLKDRRDNVARNIKPALKKNKVVILDRYFYSTIAYQGAKGIDPERIRILNEAFAVEPDLVFILDIDPARGLSRIGSRKTKDMLFEREDYLRKVRDIFLGFQGEKFVRLDAGLPVDRLAAKIAAAVLAFLEPLTLRPDR